MRPDLAKPELFPSHHFQLLSTLSPLPLPTGLDEAALTELMVGSLCSPSSFQTARLKATSLGLPVDVVLILEGLVHERAFYQVLSDRVGVELLTADKASCLVLDFQDGPRYFRHSQQSQIFLTTDGAALCPRGLSAQSIASHILILKNELQRLPAPFNRGKIWIVTPSDVKLRYRRTFQDDLIAQATDGLAVAAPHHSARGGPSAWQWLGITAIIGLIVWQEAYAEPRFWLAVFAVCSVFFFLLISLRLGACLVRGALALGFQKRPPLTDKADHALPIYTVLVPLFKETSVLGQLITGLQGLDYPKAKLDVKLLLEEVDHETIAAIRAMNLPPFFDVIVVPKGSPRTKPRALNYGLALAKGDYVVIYDAEDIPEADQLKKALGLFERLDETTATLQAKLNFYNPTDSWLAKQLTVEYCSLFDGLLPAFRLFDFPLPLGGTSNHFRINALRQVGGWDAYNVTEDADLGFRLYAHGFRSGILMSTTYEEAAGRFRDWLPQRTRWMKGWMQTYMVHMRRPFTLLRQLGLWKFIGFQAIIGGVVFSSLAHPIFLGLLLWQMPYAQLPSDLTLIALWVLSLFNLSFGYLVTMWLGLITLKFRSLVGFSFAIFTLPLYWILMSLAAYRAVVQLLYAPFYWEKTRHWGKKPS